MNFWRRHCIVVAAVALQGLALAQHSGAQETVPRVSPIVPLTTIPVPYDPLEPATSDARQVQDAEGRAAVMDLLEKAHRLSNVRLHPYELKTSFTSYGSSSSDGPWILDDTSPGANIYRWTAEGPSFSGIFLNAEKLLSSNQAGGAMPLRLAQVRDAMWGIYYPEIGPRATLRVANGYLNGAQLRCVLIARGISGKTQPEFSSGRSFDEAEYCVNAQTGLLEMYSPYPGLYVRYDYANGLHFHEQTIPNGFTITQRGKTVIEARTENVAQAPSRNSNLFEPAGLKPLGVGQVIVGPLMVRGIQSSPDASAAGQVVVLHGMVSPDGHLTEVEVLATTDEALDQAAVDHANKAGALQMSADRQPGATPQSREIVFTVQFIQRLAPRVPPAPPQ